MSVSRISRSLEKLKNLLNDYVIVGKDVVVYAKVKPVRFTSLVLASIGCVLLWRRNPDLEDFIAEVVEYSNEISQCSRETKNFQAQEYLERFLLKDSQKSLQYINLGVCSVIVERLNYKDCYNYSEVCPHLQSRWSTLSRRFVDFGLWNKWWLLQKNMIDFDVNEDDLSLLKH